MNSPLADRDYEQLSAYLDGELKPEERALLEIRLKSDALLSEALSEMGATRHILRGLPQLRAPRNFTLTPAMVGLTDKRRERYPRSFYALRFSAALSALLLFFVLLADVLMVSSPSTGVMPAAMAPSPAAMDMAEQELVEMAKELAEPTSAAVAIPAPTEEAAMTVMEAPAEKREIEATPILDAAMAAPQAGQPPQPTEVVTTAVPEAFLAETSPPSVISTALPQPLAEVAVTPMSPVIGVTPLYAEGEVGKSGRLIWRLVEVILAAILLTTGLAAWKVARHSHQSGPQRT